jgi:glycosyltransferase involved in cell wall biosynthesis
VNEYAHRVRLFSPVFNGEKWAARLLRAFADLELILASRHVSLQVLVINDASTDRTLEILKSFAQEHSFMAVHHQEERLGNSSSIQKGYSWAVNGQGARDFVGCCDFDGEHDPRDFAWYLDFLEDPKDGGNYDGVAGSIIYPQHGPNWPDLNMMRFLGAVQGVLVGAEPFYIQSPGFNLHRTGRMRRVVVELLPAYQAFLRGKELNEPRWGMHGVILHLLALLGANIHSAYIKCLAPAPNRNWPKLIDQAKAAILHVEMVRAFAEDYGITTGDHTKDSHQHV